jgi:hypothetical protein
VNECRELAVEVRFQRREPPELGIGDLLAHALQRAAAT